MLAFRNIRMENSMRLAAAILVLAMFVSFPASAATVYVYDALGRLISATYDSGKQIVYTYDAAGNRTQVVTQTTP